MLTRSVPLLFAGSERKLLLAPGVWLRVQENQRGARLRCIFWRLWFNMLMFLEMLRVEDAVCHSESHPLESKENPQNALVFKETHEAHEDSQRWANIKKKNEICAYCILFPVGPFGVLFSSHPMSLSSVGHSSRQSTPKQQQQQQSWKLRWGQRRGFPMVKSTVDV